ncbi:hypothetical protein L218DRAFT_308761 [Marasmius fiardii PR-910]|nr:hypothetical protein L218DRAFT_308761 [Marasmius fiardii PR-910]
MHQHHQLNTAALALSLPRCHPEALSVNERAQVLSALLLLPANIALWHSRAPRQRPRFYLAAGGCRDGVMTIFFYLRTGSLILKRLMATKHDPWIPLMIVYTWPE